MRATAKKNGGFQAIIIGGQIALHQDITLNNVVWLPGDRDLLFRLLTANENYSSLSSNPSKKTSNSSTGTKHEFKGLNYQNSIIITSLNISYELIISSLILLRFILKKV